MREDSSGRHAARLPLLRRDPVDLVTTDDALDALADLADVVDRPGFRSFADEVREARGRPPVLHESTRPATMAKLTGLHGTEPARWNGLCGSLGFDALAARHDHPVPHLASPDRGRPACVRPGVPPPASP